MVDGLRVMIQKTLSIFFHACPTCWSFYVLTLRFYSPAYPDIWISGYFQP